MSVEQNVSKRFLAREFDLIALAVRNTPSDLNRLSGLECLSKLEYVTQQYEKLTEAVEVAYLALAVDEDVADALKALEDVRRA